jgi:hypothetical protein
MTTATAKKTEFEEEADNPQKELNSLGIECKRKNELNDNKELQQLATAIKEVYFQDYKTAYDNGDNSQRQNTEKKSHFMIWGRDLVK